MLKKLIPVAAAAVAMLTPTAPAAAWDEVCIHLPLWRVGYYLESFTVAHGFDPQRGRPTEHPINYDVAGNRTNPSNGVIVSEDIAVNQSRCVDISGVPEGEAMMMYIEVGNGPAVVCGTHSSNPNWWYEQTDRPYRRLWYEATRTVWNPVCSYVRESN